MLYVKWEKNIKLQKWNKGTLLLKKNQQHKDC